MSALHLAFINILESGTVTVSPGSHASYPAYRLYDRDFGLMWRGVSTAAHTIKIDQGSDIKEIDALVIPEGHNLSGATLQFQYSPDDAAWSDVAPQWVQSGSAQIVKTAGAPLSARFIRLVISGASAAPQMGEIFMTRLHALSAHSRHPARRSRSKFLSRMESPSGHPYFFLYGSPRRVREYTLQKVAAADQLILDALDLEWAGCKPFFFIDHLGAGFFAELTDEISLDSASSVYDEAALNVREVLP